MKGYIQVLQWYGRIKHLDELNDPEQHTGDAKSVDSLLGFRAPEVYPTEPPCPIGHVVLRVEDDNSLSFVRANYDSSG